MGMLEHLMAWSPWVCVLAPALGAILAGPLEKAHRGLPPAVGVASSLVSLASAALMLKLLTALGPAKPFVELMAPWPWWPGSSFCLLLDPVSILMASLVAFVCTTIMVYSVGYMRHEPGVGRYWSLMCLFMASMLLLVLAGDLITMLVGWKLVGFCSYALISHYYTDEPERWVGGPPPEPMYPPSFCGLKALMTIFVGDVMFFSGVFLIYAYSGTFQLTALYATSRTWLTAMSRTPGILALTVILLTGGPLSKSAQFPFHEWLPEAMAGPTPVSALIHAATMVKAGVYVVARLLPIFYIGYHILGLPGAGLFFLLAAHLGAITAFLAAAQGCVASELKKALAYSTMSHLGYLMMGLGISGLLAEPVACEAAVFYHVIAHAISKSALFMMAGIAIHATGTIYMEEMGGLKGRMPAIWASSVLLALALMGVPPLSGFWGKEAIISYGLEARLWAPLALAVLTVPLTAFYTLRMIGMVFHGEPRHEGHDLQGTEPTMKGPLFLLALITLVVSFPGPILSSFLSAEFQIAFEAYTGLGPLATAGMAHRAPVHLLTTATSIILLALAGGASYALYVRGRPRPEDLMADRPWLAGLRRLLRARLGVDALYHAISRAFLALRESVASFEDLMDSLLNRGVPRALRSIASAVRKVQTGHLGYNMAYLMALLALVMALLALGVV